MRFPAGSTGSHPPRTIQTYPCLLYTSVLRQLPLSFFGNRDLTDLTTTIMGDTETLEKAFSHFYPAMHGALDVYKRQCLR